MATFNVATQNYSVNATANLSTGGNQVVFNTGTDVLDFSGTSITANRVGFNWGPTSVLPASVLQLSFNFTGNKTSMST